MRLILILASTVTFIFLNGCAQVQFTRKDDAAPTRPDNNFTVSHLVWGYTPLNLPPPATTLCAQSRVESVQLKMNAVDVLLAFLTLGFYVPQRVVVLCQ